MSNKTCKCPECGGMDFDIEIPVYHHFRFDEAGDHALIEERSGGLEFDDDSNIECVECCWKGQLGDAEVPVKEKQHE